MKLKKSSWAKIAFTAVMAVMLCLNISCTSNKIAVPIPGQSDAVQKNIYIEYLNIADIYFELEKYAKAETYYKAAMGNKEIYWTAYYKLAKCYAYESKWADAQTVYETLLKRDPDNNSLKASVGYIYAMNGNTDKASQIYEKLIEENPDQADYLENYICILLGAEKNEEAEAAYNTLVEKFPSSKRVEEFKKQFEKPEPEEENSEAIEQPEAPAPTA